MCTSFDIFFKRRYKTVEAGNAMYENVSCSCVEKIIKETKVDLKESIRKEVLVNSMP